MSRHALGDPALQALHARYVFYPFLDMIRREGYAGRHRYEGCGVKVIGDQAFFMRFP